MKRLASFALVVAASCGGNQDIVVGQDYKRVHVPLIEKTNKLDVLFVVDASGSMEAEQQALVEAAGQQLFAQLAADLGGPPDLHIAIISTSVSLGLAAPSVPGCPADDTDDDGRFRIGDGLTTCPITGNFLVDVDDGNGGRTTNYTGTLADAFACAATIGTGGCGFEQPLEAMRRALDGRHAGNDNFLREDALLLVAVLTDEDDCSVFDSSMFGDPNAGVTSALGPRTSFRCFEFGVVCDPDVPRAFGDKFDCVPRDDSAYITPLSEFVTFLQGVKDDPNTVMVAGMYGPIVPVTVAEDEFNPGSGIPALVPACAAPQTNVGATPPIRMAAFADQFPSRFVFESLCDSAMSQRLYRVARSASGVMSQRPCLIGNLSPTTTTERCRAFDVGGGAEKRIEACGNGTNSNCFEIAPSESCDYTPSGLTASYRGSLAAGHRLVVECLTAVE
jgi:hypothetical protein